MDAPERRSNDSLPRGAWARRLILRRRLRPSTVEIAATTSAVRLWPELPLKLHQAPDPGAVGADVRLDLGNQPADRSQVDAKEFCALLQRRCDRPAQVRALPSPH